LDSLFSGFAVSLSPLNLFCCFIGALIGTLIGVLPGIGPVSTMALLMPLTFRMSPVSAIIMLAGIYYGAQYGGSTTSILVNIPGEATSVVTTMDGYKMALQGRAGPALGIAAFGSFIAGSLGVLGLSFFGPVLSDFAIRFGPPEFCSLVFVSLMLIGYLGGKSVMKALTMASIGLLIGTVGLDPINLQPRFVFGVSQFNDGINLVPILMGLFGLAEILLNVEKMITQEAITTKIDRIFPSRRDWRDSIGPILRGSGIGFFIGLIPGGGSIIPTFVSYAVEKRISKHPERFGNGAIEGVAGPEAANNAGAQGAFVTLLTLGIPPNVTGALLLGALMIHGVKIGPLLIVQSPDIFWGFVTSMYVGNLMLLILNLPLIPLWVRVLKIPYSILFPLIVLLCMVGAYSTQNSLLDLIVLIVFAIVGYLMKKYDYEPAPMVLGLILSPILEKSFRQSLIMSQGQFSVFFKRPISAFFMGIALCLFFSHFLFGFLRKRRTGSGEGSQVLLTRKKGERK
jgi:putative tricarboxylic transport membrane protein